MGSHELARALLKMPDGELVASLDIDTGVKDKFGDVIVAKIFGYSMIDAFASQNEVVLQFESTGSGSGSSGAGVDVIEVVKSAQKVAQTTA